MLLTVEELEEWAELRAKSDANAHQIVEKLRGIGASVAYIGSPFQVPGIPDLLVGWRGVTHLMEIKNPATKGKLKPGQEKFRQEWTGGPLHAVWTVEDAFAALGLDYGRDAA